MKKHHLPTATFNQV